MPPATACRKQTSGGTQTYAYPPDSHRLTAIDAQARSYDATGSLTVRGADTLTYDARQRLSALSAYGTKATYQHNGRGERVRKSVSGIGTTYFHYDEAGRLIAESLPSANGPVRRHSYVWLDDRPVAVYVHPHTPLTPTLPYANRWLHLHTDHLGTPRAITQPGANNPVVWRWDFNGSAFGDHAPLTDPDGDGIHFTFNLRFPGQYYDVESGLHYNYFRDYEASTGRYVESDPVGLSGGIASYLYGSAAPMRFVDRAGLTFEDVQRTFDQVLTMYPQLSPRGGVICSILEGDNPGKVDNISGQIRVAQKLCDLKCFSKEEYEDLFFTLMREGAHSTDPWWQDVWAFGVYTSNHQAIQDWENFEHFRTPANPVPATPLWGQPSLLPVNTDELYRQSGSQCCE
jgi:RHS repeat-associated protein